MRRFLGAIGSVALGAALLNAPTAHTQAPEPTWLDVHSRDRLLNENGDGYWESATVEVRADVDAAHWAMTTGDRTVAEGDLTTAQLDAARSPDGASIPVSSQTMGTTLAPGTYSFTVTATASGKEPSTRSTPIHVFAGPALTSATPNAPVVYPQDSYPGVAHRVVFKSRLDPTLLKYGAGTFQVLDDNRVLDTWVIDPNHPVMQWDGQYYPPEGGGLVLAPPGTYRVRLLVADDGTTKYGPISLPVKLSWGYRVPTTRTTSRSAAGTRLATLTQRAARVRARDGRLYYRAHNTDWNPQPLVRTVHRVRIPARAPGSPALLIIRGRWQHELDPDIEIVTPSGRVINVDVFATFSKRQRGVWIPRRWIRAGGTVKFRLLWSSYGARRIGRADTVDVRVTKYAWHGLG